MTKKKNRVKPSRRAAERGEPQLDDRHTKKTKMSHHDEDENPFAMPRAAASSSSNGNGKHQKPQQQQKQQQHPQQKKQPQQHQQQQKPSKQLHSSSSSASSAAPSSGKPQKKSSAAAASSSPLSAGARLNGHALANATDPSVTRDGIEIDSRVTSAAFFAWLIYPMSISTFYSEYFEKKPLFISRRDIEAKGQVTCVTTKQTLEEMVPEEEELAEMMEKAAAAASSPAANKPAAISTSKVKTSQNALKSEKVDVVDVPKVAAAASSSSSSSASHYYSNWFSVSDIHSLLRDSSLDIQYRRDIDITRYRNGARETLNPQGRAKEEEIVKFMADECSLRFLCPQKYSAKLWSMLSRLDEFFGMQTGANSYYTPKGTQGFAPHYDDVDIFVIQTEGSKRWRLYPPRKQTEILPAVSSPNFSQAEIGSPVMDVLLNAGDFLYAPRGTIHQCVASLEEPSLHVTLSTCLGTSWYQYFSILLPRALQLAGEENVQFRKSLPHAYDRYMGVMHSDHDSNGRREMFMDQSLQLLESVMDLDLLPFDASADQMCTEFMNGCVPPPPKQAEAQVKRVYNPEQKKKSVFKLTTYVRLVRSDVARITTSGADDTVTLHHTLQNSRLFKEAPLTSIEYPIEYAETLEKLLRTYPKYQQIQELPVPQIENEAMDEEDGQNGSEQGEQDLMDLIEQLFEEGVIECSNSVAEEMKWNESDDTEEEEKKDPLYENFLERKAEWEAQRQQEEGDEEDGDEEGPYGDEYGGEEGEDEEGDEE